MAMPEYPELEKYLDEVSAHLGRWEGREDVLLELRSDVLDRAEDLGEGEITPDAVQRALATMANPAEFALAYRGERYLIGPKLYRAFVIYTGILFAVHIVMIIVATVTGTGIRIFPMNIMSLERPHSLFNLFLVAIQALLTDIGLMVLIFAGITRVRGTAALPRLAFRVPIGLRTSSTRAVLALLVAVILTFFRDDVFIVVSEDRVEPLFSKAFSGYLVWLNIFLSLVIARELIYLFFGERRFMVLLDGLLNSAGVALMIWFLTAPPFIAVPGQANVPTGAMPTLNDLMHKSMQLLYVAFAIGFSVSAMKRFFRWWQMGR
jgi:hypothetical protein